MLKCLTISHSVRLCSGESESEPLLFTTFINCVNECVSIEREYAFFHIDTASHNNLKVCVLKSLESWKRVARFTYTVRSTTSAVLDCSEAHTKTKHSVSWVCDSRRPLVAGCSYPIQLLYRRINHSPVWPLFARAQAKHWTPWGMLFFKNRSVFPGALDLTCSLYAHIGVFSFNLQCAHNTLNSAICTLIVINTVVPQLHRTSLLWSLSLVVKIPSTLPRASSQTENFSL